MRLRRPKPLSFSVSFALFACSVALSGCARKAKTPDDVLVVGIENEIKNLDLRFANDANSVHVSKLVLQGLVSIGEDLLPEPDLALSFEVKDSKIFTFKLPSDVRFHDGVKLTSKDVLYNFRQASGPDSKIKSSFEDVESFEAPDETTFVIKLKKPRPSFLAGDVAAIRIYPEHLGESPSVAEHPIGTGPFKFVRREHRDLVFERNDAYRAYDHGALLPPTSFRRVIVRAVEDPTTRFLSVVGGDLDILINALSARRAKEAEARDDLQVLRGPGSSYQYLGLNLRNPKFKDVRVRRALAMAIDREAIIRHKLKGFATPAVSVLTPQNFFFNKSLQQVPYDVEGAKKLLKEAGATDLEIEIRSSTDRDTISMLQVIQEQWRQAGIRSRLRSTEFATFFADVQKGSFEAFSLRWTSVSEPDLLNKLFHSKETPPGKNRVLFNNAEVDRLLELGASETDRAKRQQHYFKVQELIAREMPYVSLWYPDNIVVATKRLKNFKLHPTGSWMGFLQASKGDPLQASAAPPSEAEKTEDVPKEQAR